MPLPLGDVHGQFRLKEEPDLQGFLPAGDPESVPGILFGVEVNGAGKYVADGFDPLKPREGECLDAILDEVEGEQVPVPVIGQQVIGMQFVLGAPPGEGMIVSPERMSRCRGVAS